MNKLPARRMHVATEVRWKERAWAVGIGFAADGSAREVFADGIKSGQDMEALLDDACVLLSLLLQAGESAGRISSRLGRDGPAEDVGSAPSASPIGAIAEVAARVEREMGDELRRAYSISGALTREGGCE